MPDAPEHTQPLNDPEDPESFRQTLIEHLDELRTRVMRALLVLCAMWVAGWFIQPWLYAFVNEIIYEPGVVPEGVEASEAFRNFSDAFFLQLKLSFAIGVVLSSPFILFQIWGFIRPALKPAERKPLRTVVPLSVGLFVLGASFGFLVVKPAIRWFFSFLPSFEGVALIQEPGMFVMFVLKMLLAFGVGFQLPIVLWFLGQLELVTSEALARNWRHAIVGICVVAAFLTPGGDVFSLMALSLPLGLLYFAGIGALRVSERRKLKRRADAA